MRIIDLTHTISETMPVYPGTEPPALSVANTYEDSGFRETLLHLYSHTGTHMDAPRHIFADGVSLDQKEISGFVGRACVIDATAVPPGGTIDLSYLTKNEARVAQAEFVLFRTGWEAHWGTPEYFGAYPVISTEVAEYLAAHHKKGIGLDNIGLDPIADEGLSLHHIVLKQANMVIIENLCNLDQIGDAEFLFLALPLKYEDADGAPVRAIAIL